MISLSPVKSCDGCGRRILPPDACAEEVQCSDLSHVGLCQECQDRGLVLEIARDPETGELAAWVTSPHLHPSGAPQ